MHSVFRLFGNFYAFLRLFTPLSDFLFFKTAPYSSSIKNPKSQIKNARSGCFRMFVRAISGYFGLFRDKPGYFGLVHAIFLFGRSNPTAAKTPAKMAFPSRAGFGTLAAMTNLLLIAIITGCAAACAIA